MVISSELVELMALCDRVLVMSHDYIRADFAPNEWLQEKNHLRRVQKSP